MITVFAASTACCVAVAIVVWASALSVWVDVIVGALVTVTVLVVASTLASTVAEICLPASTCTCAFVVPVNSTCPSAVCSEKVTLPLASGVNTMRNVVPRIPAAPTGVLTVNDEPLSS